MDWVSGLAIYAVIWWLVIFMVLPWGARAKVDADDVAKGQDAGAPKRPRLLLKLAVTTVVAGIVWAGVYWALTSGVVSFRAP